MDFPELSERQQIWRNLLFGQRALMLRLSAELKAEFGLTTAQYEALATLWEAPGHRLRANTLAKQLLYSSGSASHLISRLEELGLVTRGACDEDARVVEVWLTDSGLDRINAATEVHLASIDREFSPLVGGDLLAALKRFAHDLASTQGVSAVGHPEAADPETPGL